MSLLLAGPFGLLVGALLGLVGAGGAIIAVPALVDGICRCARRCRYR